MLKHSAQTDLRLRNALPRIRKLFYTPTAPLDIAIWPVHGEPVPAAQAFKARYRPFQVGERWGSAWDTAWFRFRGKIPVAWKGREVVARVRLSNVDREGHTAEGLIYQNGRVSRALNMNRREIDITRSAKGGESFEFFVEAAANVEVNEVVFATEPTPPDYGGKPLFRLEQAELACVNPEVHAFYYDFKVGVEAIEHLPADSQRQAELRYALNASLNAFDDQDPASASAARALLKDVMGRRNGETFHTFSAVGHAHIDTAWLWPLRESIRKCARTFSTALDYMERYPEYVFVCSQAQHYAWMKAYYPEIWERIKKAVKRGQWEPVGSMWVETDCNVVSGESIVRQILHGKRFFQQELGYETRDAWLPDVFGYAGSLPQIFRKSGIDYFLTQKMSWNQFNVFPHHTLLWEGIDGTRIFSHFPPADDYNANTGPKHLLKAVRNFKEHGRATRSIFVYGFGDGGGGPSIEMLEKGRRARDFDGLPKFEPEKALAFFKKALADARDLPVWVGELYLEVHRGTYTSQGRIKRANRKSEFLLHDAEFFDAVSSVLVPQRREKVADPKRAVYDVTGLGASARKSATHRAALERAWKLLLLNQFHDIIPGTSINWVYQDCDRDYEAVRELGQSVLDSAFHALEPLINTRGAGTPLLVFNTLGFARDEIVQLPDGALIRVEVPACGYAVIDRREALAATPPNPVSATTVPSGFVLENGLVRVKIDQRGHLTSVYDLVARRETLSGPGNVLQLHEDIPNQHNAWEVDVYYKETSVNLDQVDQIKLVESGPLRAVVRVKRSFGQSSIEQSIVLRANSARVDFEVEADWQERQKFLKVAFPVAIRAMNATYEIQFGHLERPTHMNTSWDMARFEVCGQKWADLSETGYGVALLNDCKYGYDIEGQVMRLSLLRGPIMPDPYADLGRHRFTYTLYPHQGRLSESRVIEEAYVLNVPLLVHEVKKHGGPLPPMRSFFEAQNAVIETIKIAEDGNGVIVRLYEARGARGPARFTTTLPLCRVALTDLLENEIEVLTMKKGAVSFDLQPFEIVTLKLAF